MIFMIFNERVCFVVVVVDVGTSVKRVLLIDESDWLSLDWSKDDSDLAFDINCECKTV